MVSVKMNRLSAARFPSIDAFISLLGLIPQRQRMAWARGLGTLWFALDRRHRNVAVANLTRAFGREKTARDIRHLARRVFQNVTQIPFEIAWSLHADSRQLLARVAVEGFCHVQNAFAEGKGVLLLTGHCGNWELLPPVLLHAGYRLNIVYRPLDFRPAEDFFRRYRTRFGARLIAKKKSMRRIIRCLDRNEGVGILLDQDSGLRAGVFADFFGHKACTNKGLALLALKTKAPVVPAFIRRGAKGFVVECGRRIPLVDTGCRADDIRANTLRYNRAIEAFVRRYPDQWFWIHRRWKNQPPDAPGTGGKSAFYRDAST